MQIPKSALTGDIANQSAFVWSVTSLCNLTGCTQVTNTTHCTQVRQRQHARSRVCRWASCGVVGEDFWLCRGGPGGQPHRFSWKLHRHSLVSQEASSVLQPSAGMQEVQGYLCPVPQSVSNCCPTGAERYHLTSLLAGLVEAGLSMYRVAGIVRRQLLPGHGTCYCCYSW